MRSYFYFVFSVNSVGSVFYDEIDRDTSQMSILII